MDGSTPETESTRRYGEETLADVEAQAAVQAATPVPVTTRHINWKQVGRVALWTVGLAAAAVAAYFIVGPAVGWALSQIGGTQVIGGAFAWTAHTLVSGAGWLFGAISTPILAVGHAIGTALAGTAIAHTPVLAGPAVHAGAHFASIAGASATVIAGIPLLHKQVAAAPFMLDSHGYTAAGVSDNIASQLAIKKALAANTPDISTPAPDGTGLEINGATTTAANHSATHSASLGHHVTDEDRPGWMQRVAAKSAYQQTLAGGGSYTDAVLAAQAAAYPTQARNKSFSEQLKVDRAALESALGQPNRG